MKEELNDKINKIISTLFIEGIIDKEELEQVHSILVSNLTQ